MAPRAAPKGTMKRFLGLQKHYSRILFTPNGIMRDIDSTTLTPAEIEATIPKRPDFSHLPKYHHEMLSPEYIADIFVKPSFTDVVVSALAHESPFSGDPNYKFVSQTSSFREQTVKLHFANIVALWVDVFNDQIATLAPLAEELGLEFTNAERSIAIEAALLEFTNERNLYEKSTLEAFYARFGIFHGRTDLQLGDRKKISFENVTEHLFATREVAEDSKKFRFLLEFVDRNIGLCTNEGVERILVALIKHLYSSKERTAAKLQAFDAFFSGTVVEVYPHISSSLSPHDLDRLAQLLTFSRNLKGANCILVVLAKQKKTAPSRATFDAYLEEFAQLIDATSPKKYRKEKILQELHKLKPVFFHHGLSNCSFCLLLDHVIDNIFDLDQLMRLVETTGNSKKLFIDNGAAIFKKLQDLQNQSGDSQLMKALQLTQLVRKIGENGADLGEESKKVVRGMYVSLGQAANADCI